MLLPFKITMAWIIYNWRLDQQSEKDFWSTQFQPKLVLKEAPNAYSVQGTSLKNVLPCVHRSASELRENRLQSVPAGLTHHLSAVATPEVPEEKGADASTGQNWLPNETWRTTGTK